MSDPNRPPFTQSPNPHPPGIHYDNDGNAWYLNSDSMWVPYTGPLLQPPSQHTIAQPNPRPPVNPTSRQGNQDNAAPVQEYNFSMRPFSATPAPHLPASTSRIPNSTIDLRLPPLPDDDDDDLSDPVTIARARGLQPAKKVAGARRKIKDAKGKKRRRDSDSDDASDEPVSRRGRPSGSGNYSKEDTKYLLDMVERELPLGGKGWKIIARKYKKWARNNGRPERGLKSLETKYKQIKKPTGDASCPPEVKRAHQIEELINQRAGT
ncbi:hypothetical protein B0H10DRAFT_2435371 [Mycena sp. CBHHK59/15]|nr:hypothetical protein B0H10DRAFT_2435371 [Mycena sp. CBHHK59/15]